ncbi:MAG: hypothetical protein K8U57_35365 [Planctomycetes bacterium]|nr:hypothetical protein [Planctomycetota bacterium]
MSSKNSALSSLHDAFLQILPKIEAHARAAFRSIRCPHDREDGVAEVIAHAWEQFTNLTQPGAISPEQLALCAIANSSENPFTCARCSE